MSVVCANVTFWSADCSKFLTVGAQRAREADDTEWSHCDGWISDLTLEFSDGVCSSQRRDPPPHLPVLLRLGYTESIVICWLPKIDNVILCRSRIRNQSLLKGRVTKSGLTVEPYLRLDGRDSCGVSLHRTWKCNQINQFRIIHHTLE